MGDISTHVISKLGLGSVAGSTVQVYYNADLKAGPLTQGWQLLKTTSLSANGGNDTLVEQGSLKKGLYMLQYDFSGVDAASRQIFRREDSGEYVTLNPTGFFLASSTSFTLKIEDETSFNHLVVSVGDKEITVRPGVRAH
mmetsp:Transcript_15697/g.18914  ORF Transcript_15697/g.18914 Transcript_15697/m.18914 type:complete len:140 (-) Transcript_15697:485-904(-)|eukprot:CAMPEP_0197857690 /NCGR_PEP_ID=MMETSP1438-20131217/31013_1 /TAXON_ID=1461541 /ORGANISM="Pterosperma sp., Strain CCMP1384" /LENGTH=139 /DNA_ID=CAMNT_0043473613 /DNA_START=282 /DNA_END=701 /DNA_ORIENTATION=+